MKFYERNASSSLVVASLLLTAAHVFAQVQVLPETPITLNGALSLGFAGGSGSGLGANASSSDSLTLGARADLEGYYHDPRFLQFNVAPRFTWSRNSQVAANALQDRDDGVLASADFLESSRTPVHATYDFGQVNSSTLTGGPDPFTVGATGFTQAFTISTAPRLQPFPPLNISYSRSMSDVNVLGVQSPSQHTDLSLLNVFSNYTLEGFHMNGAYTRNTSESKTEDLLNLGIPIAPSNSTSQSESFGVSHSLPLSGSMAAAVSHTDDNYNLSGTPQTASFDSAAASVSLIPIPKLAWFAGADYTSNATNQLISQVINGEPTSSSAILGTGQSFTLDTNLTYQIGHGFYATGSGENQTSKVAGDLLTQNLAFGTINYGRYLWHGVLTAGYSLGWDSLELDSPGNTIFGVGSRESQSNSGLYNVATATYQHRVGNWMAQGNFSYMHNDAYLGGVAPSAANAFAVNGSGRTRIRYSWNLMVSGSVNKSEAAGYNSNLSELFTGQISNRTWSFNGQYQRNNGYFLFAQSSTAVPGGSTPELQPSYSVTQGYSFAASYSRRKLSMMSSFSRTNGSYDTQTGPSTTENSYLDLRLYYKFRKLDFQAGFRRLTQDASTNSALNQTSYGYWISVVRQFHAF